MTIERALVVRLPVDDLDLGTLVDDIKAAADRAKKALPGDRTDVIRYEAASSKLERAAQQQLGAADAEVIEIAAVDRAGHCFWDDKTVAELPPEAASARDWIAAGDVAVEVRQVLLPGDTPFVAGQPVPEPAGPWAAPPDEDGRQPEGTRAVAVRFEQQLEQALNGEPRAALRPSGVSNRVLTNGLRKFVTGDLAPRRDVPVIYKDGSTGPAFPLRCLPLTDAPPAGWRIYHFALLSIRHTEMDVAVDGAWFRNTDVSRPRPAGETDRLAGDLSRKQLSTLCSDEPVLLYVYQTGLDTAVVGFYRAVVQHLLRDHEAGRPGSIAVVPMYFRRQPPGQEARSSIAGYEPQSSFDPGTMWVL